MKSDKRSDYQLEQVFTQELSWEVRGKDAVSAPQKTLQGALQVAGQAMASNQIVNCIVRMPDEDVVILTDQIHRLLKKFRFTYT